MSRFDVANGIHSYHLPSLVPVTSNGTILNIDHIIPISKGGSRRAHENMVTSCESCNLRKQNIIPAGIEIEKVIIVKNILSMIKKDNITRERLKRVNAAIHRKADDVQCINEREVKKYIRSLTKKFCVEFENFDDSMYELIPKNYK